MQYQKFINEDYCVLNYVMLFTKLQSASATKNLYLRLLLLLSPNQRRGKKVESHVDTSHGLIKASSIMPRSRHIMRHVL